MEVFQKIKKQTKLENIHSNLVLVWGKNIPIYGTTIPQGWGIEQMGQLIYNKLDSYGREFDLYKIESLGDFSDDSETIVLDVSPGVPDGEIIHTLAHEWIHVLQYNLEFKEEREIPFELHHNSQVWLKYTRILGLTTIESTFTEVKTGGFIDRLIKE